MLSSTSCSRDTSTLEKMQLAPGASLILDSQTSSRCCPQRLLPPLYRGGEIETEVEERVSRGGAVICGEVALIGTPADRPRFLPSNAMKGQRPPGEYHPGPARPAGISRSRVQQQHSRGRLQGRDTADQGAGTAKPFVAPHVTPVTSTWMGPPPCGNPWEMVGSPMGELTVVAFRQPELGSSESSRVSPRLSVRRCWSRRNGQNP